MSTGARAAADVDGLATKADRQAAVMLWNYHDVDAPAAATPTAVTVSGIPAAAGRILVTQYRIDETHSNAYTVWKDMGSPQHPTPEQYARLQSQAGLQLLNLPEWMDAKNGSLTVRTEMPRQSVSLLLLTW